MGVRTGAARLGLGLPARWDQKQKLSSFSQFIRRRRSSTLAAAVSGKKSELSKSDSGSELNKEKTLYLCFSEISLCDYDEYRTEVIRPIKLSQLLSTTSIDVDDDSMELREATYKRMKLQMSHTNCSRFGSQILFAGGFKQKSLNALGYAIPSRDICSFDTRDPSPKFQVSSPRKTRIKIKSFPTGKNIVRLGEVDRKLYCLGHNPRCYPGPEIPCEPFEVFDPEDGDDPKWRPLAPPPFINHNTYDFSAAFVEGSNKILGWEGNKPEVFAFDVARPENGWIKSPSRLGGRLPTLSSGVPFFIHHNHPNFGGSAGFQLMFTYDPVKTPQIVPAVFLMSHNCDSLQPINKPLRLPDLPYEFLTSNLKDVSPTEFQFVHLGEKKVCLILYKFFYPRLYLPEEAYTYWMNEKEMAYNQRNMGSLLLITFEYDINSVNSESSLDIQLRLLGTHRFHYLTKQLRKPNPTDTSDASLAAAYLL
ncbi:hypothetical protein M0R45_014641 [Rubus argutus]|uniref:Uncharacterized protein n=1 Tax=Rubus argutus TaxID=59490 RepID=A0AAW1XPJ2_RUBAR